MSETVTPPVAAPAAESPAATPAPIATSAPGAVISEPTSGTTPEVAADTVATPADFPAAPEAPTSILSEAAPEPEPAAPVEAEAEAPPEPLPPPEPLAPPVYEPFKLPEGVELAEEKVSAFTGLLGEFENKVTTDPAAAHAAAQEFGQKVLDLYVAESQAAAAAYAKQQQESWTALNEQWAADFRADPQLGGNRVNTSLQRMGALMDLYGQHAGADRLKGVREAFALTGAGNHPEVLRFAHFMASRLTETSRPVQAAPRAPNMPRSKANHLYRNSVGAA